jgi:hypothetical protein
LPVGALKNLKISTAAIIRNKISAAIIMYVALVIGLRTGSPVRSLVLFAIVFLLSGIRRQATCRAAILFKNPQGGGFKKLRLFLSYRNETEAAYNSDTTK